MERHTNSQSTFHVLQSPLERQAPTIGMTGQADGRHTEPTRRAWLFLPPLLALAPAQVHRRGGPRLDKHDARAVTALHRVALQRGAIRVAPDGVAVRGSHCSCQCAIAAIVTALAVGVSIPIPLLAVAGQTISRPGAVATQVNVAFWFSGITSISVLAV